MKKRNKTTEIIIHCTANVPYTGVSADDITKYHKSLGWEDCGYHYVIDEKGKVFSCRPVDSVGAHCTGHNSSSIGIAYIGGLDKVHQPCNTLTYSQACSLVELVYNELHRYDLKLKDVHVHNEFANKACPCFSKSFFDEMYNKLLDELPF